MFKYSWKLARTFFAWNGGTYRKPLQILTEGKHRAVKLVTIPKLFAPPLRARHRSELSDAEAITMEPDARTTV